MEEMNVWVGPVVHKINQSEDFTCVGLVHRRQVA